MTNTTRTGDVAVAYGLLRIEMQTIRRELDDARRRLELTSAGREAAGMSTLATAAVDANLRRALVGLDAVADRALDLERTAYDCGRSSAREKAPRHLAPG